MLPAVTPSQEQPTPSQESELSLDVYESAHSEAEDDDEDDDQLTERAPSEDERDDPDTPPIGPTPVTAIAKLLNGGAKENQGTESQHQ
jgi:hypothetical protein